jgi:UDP-2-acetamido-2,6-beta-L-arabino-hexul-4-ose reductase
VNLLLADMGDPLTRKLYSTYLSHLPEDAFGYGLKEHRDERGAFAECLKSLTGGQVSVNVTKPGMTKGGHWHHTKTEKIIVVSGSALLRFQKLGDERVLMYPVSSEKLEVVDVPPGYIHDITNTGSADMVMLVWASQIFDPEHPDTYPAKISSPPRGGELP